MKAVNIFLLTLLFFSCSDDSQTGDDKNDNTATEKKVYIIDLSNVLNLGFVTVTNIESDILFEYVGNEIDTILRIETSNDDKLNLSIGFESSIFFNYQTYIDIDEFWQYQIDDCNNELVDKETDRFDVTVDIEGINDFKDFYHPLKNSAYPTKNTGLNKLVLEGDICDSKDILLTHKDFDNNLRSTLLEYSNWTKINESELKYTADFTDFKELNSHRINTGIAAEWIYGLDILTNDQNVITSSFKPNYNNREKSDHIDLIIPEDNIIEKIKLFVRGVVDNNDYKSELILDNLPVNLEMYDPLPGKIEILPESFEINCSDEYDYLKTQYFYENGNWSIYHKYSEVHSFEFPTLPEEYLQQSNHQVVLENFNIAWVVFIKGEDITIQDVSRRKVDDFFQGNCKEYKSKTISIRP